MNKNFWIASIGAAFVVGMMMSATPVFGPHFTTWDSTIGYFNSVEKKLDNLSKFFDAPSNTRGIPDPTDEERRQLLQQLADIKVELEELDDDHKDWINLLS